MATGGSSSIELSAIESLIQRMNEQLKSELKTEIETVRRELADPSDRDLIDESGDDEEGPIAGRGETGRSRGNASSSSASARRASGQNNAGESPYVSRRTLAALQTSAPKFGGSVEQFNSWSLVFKGYCSTHGVFTAFESDVDVPVEKVQNDPDFASRFTSLQIERAIIAWNILTAAITSDTLQFEVYKMESPTKGWKFLNDRFAPKTYSQVQLFETKFNNVSMTPGTDPIVFLNEVTLIASRLSQLGFPKAEEVVCLKFLGSLPDEYEGIRATLLVGNDLTETTVRSTIARQYDLIQQRSLPASNAFVARVGRKGGSRNFARDSGKRVNGKGTGGGAMKQTGRTGKASKPEMGRSRRPQKEARCIRCNAKNHKVAECKARVIQAPSQVDPDSDSGEFGSALALIYVVNDFLRRGREEIWIGDSGAAYHMTGNLECLFDLISLSILSPASRTPEYDHSMLDLCICFFRTLL